MEKKNEHGWALVDFSTYCLIKKHGDGCYEIYQTRAAKHDRGGEYAFHVVHVFVHINRATLKPIYRHYEFNESDNLKHNYWKRHGGLKAASHSVPGIKACVVSSETFTWEAAVERIIDMSGYKPEEPDVDDLFLKFMERVKEHTVGAFVFRPMKNREGGIIITDGVGQTYLVFSKRELDRLITHMGLPLRLCDICGSVMDSGWTDEFGETHFCKEEEFFADMDERYGAGNWRVEPSGKEEWCYEARKDSDSPWMPEPSYYTEWTEDIPYQYINEDFKDLNAIIKSGSI